MQSIIGLLSETDGECITNVHRAYVSAIECSGGVPYVTPISSRAYQWHPERLCGTDENNKKIFDEFIKISTKGE